MAIVGIGTDIIEIDRIQKSYDKFGDRFVDRILSDLEKQSRGFRLQPVRYLAKRFAAKEALLKSLGLGLAKGLRFDDFSVLNDDQGKPVVHVSGMAESLMQSKNITQFHISISDEKRQAIAFVIAES